MKLHFLLLCLCELVAARPSELHKPAPSVRLNSRTSPSRWGPTASYLPAWSDKRCKICSVAVPPCRPIWAHPFRTYRARRCAGRAQQFSDQKCNFISMCPLEACCGGVSLRVMGYGGSKSVTTRRLSLWCLKTNPLFFCRSLISKSQIMCTLPSWMAPALASWSSVCDI